MSCSDLGRSLSLAIWKRTGHPQSINSWNWNDPVLNGLTQLHTVATQKRIWCCVWQLLRCLNLQMLELPGPLNFTSFRRSQAFFDFWWLSEICRCWLEFTGSLQAGDVFRIHFRRTLPSSGVDDKWLGMIWHDDVMCLKPLQLGGRQVRTLEATHHQSGSYRHEIIWIAELFVGILFVVQGQIAGKLGHSAASGLWVGASSRRQPVPARRAGWISARPVVQWCSLWSSRELFETRWKGQQINHNVLSGAGFATQLLHCLRPR